jgi:hypothetical protein
MASVSKSLLFIVLMMVLIYLSLSLVPNISKLSVLPKTQKPLISSPSDCSKLNGSSLIYECIVKFANESKSDALCVKLNNTYYRDLCYAKQNEGKETSSACDKISIPVQRGECFAKLARSAKNREECLKAVATSGSAGDAASDACLFSYATKMDDRESCGLMVDPNQMGNCLYFFVSMDGNASGCDSRLSDASDACLLRLALNSLDADVCQKIQGQKDDCYFDIANSKKDRSLCSYITNRELFGVCVNLTG